MQQYIYGWLLACGLGHVVLGLGFIGFMASPWSDAYLNHWVRTLGLSETHGLVPALQFLGPTVASWGLLFCLATYAYRLTGARGVRLGMVAAIVLWLAADTSLSAWYGLDLHYGINAGAGLALLLPLLLWRVAPTVTASD